MVKFLLNLMWARAEGAIISAWSRVEKGKNKNVNSLHPLLLILGISSFTLFFFWLSMFRLERLTAYAYDLGIFIQAVWLMSVGETPFVTLRGLHIFADHFSPILLAFVPLYRIYPHPFWFLFFQSLAFGICAVPLFRLAFRWRLPLHLASFLSFASLFHPAFFSMLFFDFHPLVLSIPLLLWGLLAIEEGKARDFFVALFFALTCREDVALPAFCLCLYGLMRKRFWCIFGALMALAWFFLATKVMAYLSENERVFYLALYSKWGGSPAEILKNWLIHPFEVIREMLTARGIQTPPGFYPILLLAPFGFIPLLGCRVLLFSLPCFAFLTLGDRPAMRDLGFQHTALIIFWVMAANLRGWMKLISWLKGLPKREQIWWRIVLVTFWSICLICFAVRYGKSAFAVFARDKLSGEDAKKVRQILWEKVPPSASVSAPTTFVVPLAHRKEIYLFPNPFIRCLWGADEKALLQMDGKEKVVIADEGKIKEQIKKRPVEFVVIKRFTNWWPMEISDFKRLVDILLNSDEYEVVANVGDFYVLRAKN